MINPIKYNKVVVQGYIRHEDLSHVCQGDEGYEVYLIDLLDPSKKIFTIIDDIIIDDIYEYNNYEWNTH